MTADAPHALDHSIREAAQALESMNVQAPEVLLLLGTGTEDLSASLGEVATYKLGDLPSCPGVWKESELLTGRASGVRLWALCDAPLEEETSWDRAWPIWLARSQGAGACLITAGACATGDLDGTDFLLASDHMIMDGSKALHGLATSTLGPLFPDQGRVHDETSRAALMKAAASSGLPCTTGVLACTPGPSLETPAEREYYSRAGAHATVQGLGPLLHAMAHSGLPGLCLLPLIGRPDASVEALIQRSEELAPALAELIERAIPLLASTAQREQEEEL